VIAAAGEDAAPGVEAPGRGDAEQPGEDRPIAAVPVAATGAPITKLSYSSLGEYARCGYRFYLERVLALPRLPLRGSLTGPPAGAPAARSAGRLNAAERGVLAHALLERLDFRRPARSEPEHVIALARAAGLPEPSEAETEQLAGLVERFGLSDLCARLAAATDVRREERFAFLLEPGGALVNGFLDVLAREGLGGAQLLVVDYKSDRLEGAEPAAVVERVYATQRLVYALAALRSGARRVEVAHVFLEHPEAPVLAGFASDAAPALGAALSELASGVLAREFPVSDAPHRALCDGCPGEDGLCSWPPAMTRRQTPEQLF
jgi:ATP-dependent helicase/nuclease subunit A